VQLTPAGVAARERAFDIMSEPPKSFERLSASEARQLAELLAKASDVAQ
jgi:hypothetical protein